MLLCYLSRVALSLWCLGPPERSGKLKFMSHIAMSMYTLTSLVRIGNKEDILASADTQFDTVNDAQRAGNDNNLDINKAF